MKNIFKFIILLCLYNLFTITSPAQNINTILDKKITVNIQGLSVQDALKTISDKSGIGFSYSNDLVNFSKIVTINGTDQPLNEVLDQLVSNTFISFTIVGNQVVFQTRKKTSAKHSISGYVSDKETGELLTGVNIYEETTNTSAITNEYGFYNIILPENGLKLKFTYVGYNPEIVELALTGDKKTDVQLSPSPVALQEVTITDKAIQKQIESTQMGESELQMKTLKSVPVLLGESDIMKTLQLMPGIQQGSEGSSSLFIRGGSPDQNLILLDDAPIFNVNHLFGFISTFNDDGIQSAIVLKGGIPARYGGRLSSVVDIKTKEGNHKKFLAQIAIGTLASRLTLEGPIYDENTSFIFSARRTYLDLLYRPLMKIYSSININESIDEYYDFQDFNFKINHTFSPKSHLYFSSYYGSDVLKVDHHYSNLNSRSLSELVNINWGNFIATTRWNYQLNEKLFSNVSLIFSQYQLQFSVNDAIKDSTNLTQKDNGSYNSGIQDYSAKVDFDYYLSSHQTMRFGIQSSLYNFNPGKLSEGSSIENIVNSEVDTSLNLSNIHLVENDAYIEDEITFTPKLKANIGLRYSFANVEGTIYKSFQPRINLRYLITDNWSAKASWSVMGQNLNLLSGSPSINIPLDLWIPATKSLKPQHSEIYSLGTLFGLENNIDFSSEIYYKTMQNVLDFKDGSSFVFANNNWANIITQGKGIAYGAEFMAEKKSGKTFGWLDYSLSKSLRQYNEIDNGNWFPYQFDHLHNLNLVVVHRFSEDFEIGGSFVLSSGNLFTVNNEKFSSYLEHGKYVDSYSSRFNFQGPLYNRLDLNMSFTKQKKWGLRTWTISCYNVYNQHNPTAIFVDNEKTVHQIASMPIIPSVTYTYKFGKGRTKSESKDIYYDLPPDTMKFIEKKIVKDTLSKDTIAVTKNDSVLCSTKKGSRLMVINLSTNYSSTNIAKTGSLSTNITLAKFRANNFAMGSQIGFSYNRNFNYTDTTFKKIIYINTYSFSYGLLFRYYIGNWTTRPFIQAAPSMTYLNHYESNGTSYGLNFGLGIPFGIGIAHFISDRVAFEAVILDNNIFNPQNTSLSFKFGFQIYFPYYKTPRFIKAINDRF